MSEAANRTEELKMKIDGYTDRQVELAELRAEAKQKLVHVTHVFDAHPTDANARNIGRYREALKRIEAACDSEKAPSPITVNAAQGLYL